MRKKLPALPKLLDRKLYKTGQSRGADDDAIFQNRVLRKSTVLIPYEYLECCLRLPTREKRFESGFIVLISPKEYFHTADIDKKLAEQKLRLGMNAVVFYETREEWMRSNPEKLGWKPAQRRQAPLGGKYVCRIPAITSARGARIVRGFTSTASKGAGIRVFEYASSKTIQQCRDQLESIFWSCSDAEAVATSNGMTPANASARKAAILRACLEQGLLDYERLIKARVVNAQHETICPLCLEKLSGAGFFKRMQQAEGRAVHDLTITEINLFHIDELRIGVYNHHPYSVGWGHHHCNVVAKDSGILNTLTWMRQVLERNIQSGYLDPTKSGSSS